MLYQRSCTLSLLSKSTVASSTERAHSSPEGNKLNLLLESTPDSIQVLSLKGSLFLVHCPFCVSHQPVDLVPLKHEFKESSVIPGNDNQGSSTGPRPPKTVNLLYRAQSKAMGYVWVPRIVCCTCGWVDTYCCAWSWDETSRWDSEGQFPCPWD